MTDINETVEEQNITQEKEEQETSVEDNNDSNVANEEENQGDEEEEEEEVKEEEKEEEKEELGDQSLITAVQLENIKQVKSILAKNPSIVSVVDASGDTALHHAVKHRMLMNLLIKNKADVNAQNKSGTTPLHKAAMKENMDVVKLLVKSKADVMIKNNAGLMPENTVNPRAVRVIEFLQGDSIVWEEVFVPKKHHGKVIGKKGATLRDLQRSTKALFFIPNKNDKNEFITVQGREDSVEQAKIELNAIVASLVPANKSITTLASGLDSVGKEQKFSFFAKAPISKSKHRIIVGKGGKTIKGLEAEFKVKIELPTTEENNVFIKGEEDDVFNCLKKINELIAQANNRNTENKNRRGRNNNASNSNGNNSNNNSNNNNKRNKKEQFAVNNFMHKK